MKASDSLFISREHQTKIFQTADLKNAGGGVVGSSGTVKSNIAHIASPEAFPFPVWIVTCT